MELCRGKSLACIMLILASFAGASPPRAEQAPIPTEQPVRKDVYGDPLPRGAVARMGTMRLRHSHVTGSSCAFSPDGKLLVSAGMEDIRIWQRATGKLLRRIPIRDIRDDRQTLNFMVKFASDGRRLACSGDYTTYIWDVTTGQRLHEFRECGGTPAWSPDGKQLAVASQQGVLFLYAATGGQLAKMRLPKKVQRMEAQFAADGKAVVLWEEAHVYRWNLADQKFTAIPLPPGYSGFFIAPDGQRAALVPRAMQEGLRQLPGKGEPVALWHFGERKKLIKLQGDLAYSFFGVVFSDDGKTLVMNTSPWSALGEEAIIGFWDTESGVLRRRLRLPLKIDYKTALRLSPDGRTLATLPGSDAVIRLWDVETGKEALAWPAHVNRVRDLAFTPDGKSLVSGSLDRTVRVWDVASGRQFRQLPSHRWSCNAVAVSPDGKILLSGGSDGCLTVQDRESHSGRRILLGRPPEEQQTWAPTILGIRVTPDSKTAVTYSRDPDSGHANYHSWDLATGKRLNSRSEPSGNWGPTEFSADARLVVEDLWERVPDEGLDTVGVVVREVASGKEVLRLRDPGRCRVYRSLSPDGRTVLTGLYGVEQTKSGWRCEHTLYLWEVATGKERLHFTFGAAEECIISRFAFAPNHRMLAGIASNGTIHFWDSRTGRELPGRLTPDATAMDMPYDESSHLVFSPDSKLLATTGQDGTILLWKAASAPPPDKVDTRQIEQWWTDLASDDAGRAYRAICGLSDQPEAVRLLRERLRPATEGPREQIKKLIADLDSPDFARRNVARKQLLALEDQAAPALRAAASHARSEEQRRRVEQLLSALDVIRSPERLRSLRALEVLERLATSDASRVIYALSKGIPESRITQEAIASLERLTARTPTIP
jgi:WD40 repeat protein